MSWVSQFPLLCSSPSHLIVLDSLTCVLVLPPRSMVISIRLFWQSCQADFSNGYKKKKNGICLVCAVVFGTGGMLFTASFTALYMGFWWFPRCDVCVVWCLLCLTDKFHQRDSKQTFEFLSFMRQKKLNSVKNPGVFLFCLFFCSGCHLTGQSSNMQLTLKGHLLFYSGAKRSTHEHTAARDSHTKGWPLTKRPISSAIQDQV